MYYSVELQIVGVILLSAMTAGGVSLWLKRRKEKHELDASDNEAQN